MNPGGFGTFGSPYTLRPAGLFGTTTATAPTLGAAQPQPTTSLFSTNASPFTFGAGAQSTQPSGGLVVGLGQPQQQQQQQITGTAGPKFAPPQGTDQITKGGVTTTISTLHQCITAMKEYEAKSLEELRLEDYQAGRKYPPSTGAFGATSGGGLFANTGATSTAGGGGSIFGATSGSAVKPLMFGASPSTAAQPATVATGGIFGGAGQQTQANRSFFGGTTGTTAGSTFTGFGSQPTQTSAFGTTNQPQQTSIFGGLGGSTTAPGTGLFGSTQQTTTGLFGSTQATKPVFPGFGGTTTTTTGAGQPQFNFATATAPTTANTTTQSLFGGGQQTATTTSTANRPAFGAFGTTTTTTPQTGAFGTTTTTPQTTTGLFGTTAAQPRTSFGGLGTTGTTGTTGAFGSFGTTTTTPQTGMFGSAFGSTSQPGATTATTASPFGGGLGGTTATGGLGGTSAFGTTQQSGGSLFQQQQNTPSTGGTGLFGLGSGSAQPGITGAGGLQPLGTTTTTTTSPFGVGFGGIGAGGATSTQPTTTTTTGSLFGGPGLTGTTSTQPAAGGGLFGTNTTTSNPNQFGLGSTGGLGSLGVGTGPFGLSGGTQTSSSFGLNLNPSLQQNTLAPLSLNTSAQQQQQQFQLQQLGQQQQQQLQQQQQQLQSLSNSPYGGAMSQLLKSTLQDLNNKQQHDILKPLSPIAQRQYIVEATSPPKVTTVSAPSTTVSSLTSDFRGGLSQSIKITPKVLTSISVNRASTGSIGGSGGSGGSGLIPITTTTTTSATSSSSGAGGGLFEGLEEDETPCFYPRRNIKKLLFRPSGENRASRRPSGSGSSGSINGDTLKKQNYSSNDDSLRLGSNLSNGLNANINVHQAGGGVGAAAVGNGSGGGTNPAAFGSSFMANQHLITQDISDDGLPSSTTHVDTHSEVSTTSSTTTTSSSLHPHPAGIVLERPGYFTIPSMQDLGNSYDGKTGECLAENFSIGRVDYGCITFPGVTNVAGMNLDEIVHIRRKEVHVYPDDTRKPPLGHGLNKPAEITLHRIWPVDKHTKLPITDPNRIIDMGYNKKIERATIEMGATFIDYDPVTGSWTFKVKHFSKYGLNDSDDEGDGEADLTQLNANNLNQLGGSKSKQSGQQLKKSSALVVGGGPSATAATGAQKLKQPDLLTTSDEEMTATASRRHQQRREKEMIEKQLKLIEARRLELMQQHRKGSIGVGLNAITHQQWDHLINEYNQPSSKAARTAAFELSTDERSDVTESDDLDAETESVKKALVLDVDAADETVTDMHGGGGGGGGDENKENKSLYPSLAALKKKKAGERLYPNLDDVKTSVGFSDGVMNYEEDKESLKLHRDDEFEEKPLTFVGADRFMAASNVRESRKFTEMFFNEDDDYEDNNEYRRLYGGFKGEGDEFKYSGFNQKPITMGLLKRGLGVISMLNQETNKLTIGSGGGDATRTVSSSLKGDQFHGEAKVAKFAAYSVAAVSAQKIGDHPDADNVDHMKMVWSLCENLWGDIPESFKSTSNDANLTPYEVEQIRKRLLSEWLSDVSSHRVEKECKYMKFNKNKESYLSSIFSLLTANRLLDACNLAVENLDFRLALLISQSSAGGNDTVRDMVRKQLREWSTSGSNKFIHPDRLKLYVLIAGELIYNLNASTQTHHINVCENLDWKRQFAINLWYQSLPVNSINDALNGYEKCVADEISNKPLPPYLEDSVESKGDNNNRSSRRRLDTCYQLIKLYCDSTHSIEDVIDPSSHTTNQLDYRLSWHLAMALLSVGYTHMTRACAETVHDSYAHQLHSLGAWHWSIFVLMHIENESRREQTVKSYLARHVSPSDELDAAERFVIERLHVPPVWVYELKAMRVKSDLVVKPSPSHSLYQHSVHFSLLMRAHKWNDAHALLVDALAPDLFLKQNFHTLHQYLVKLSVERDSINKWNVGGQVYLDFIRLKQRADVLFTFSHDDLQEKIMKQESYTEIHNELLNLSSRLKEFDTKLSKSPKKLLCSLHMCKLLLKFFIAFYELTKSTDGGDSQDEDDDDDDNGAMDDEETTGRRHSVNEKLLTKSIVERAAQQAELVPDQNLFTVMLLKKAQYMKDFLMPSYKTRH